MRYFFFHLIFRRGHEVTAVIPFNDESDKYTVISSDPEGNLLKELGKNELFVQTFLDLFRLVQTSADLSRHVLTCPDKS